MDVIYYSEAAKIIGVTIGSLMHAVSRGELTRAGRRGHYLCLLRKQVELFRGRRISYKALSDADKALWLEYDREARALLASSEEEDINTILDRRVNERLSAFEESTKQNIEQEFHNLVTRFFNVMEGEKSRFFSEITR